MRFPLRTPGFAARQALGAGLALNALRSMPGSWAGIPAFFAGWLTTELAPHLLAATALDAAQHVARHGQRSSKTGLAPAAASSVGLGALMAISQRARDEIEDALCEALGPDYVSGLSRAPSPDDLATPWGQLAMPFRVRDPSIRSAHVTRGVERFLEWNHRRSTLSRAA